ncbi:hypothetical protein SASPL_148603 [Salvia splendens]|uniref:DAGKc domain-containing protein n=1 Tax=Salvia splendens TaxID=180675 RepID=A0A8X8WAG8_SALSN|nr:hypothetical protein SASPL_148603 [Salvia splendens]
MEVNIGDVYAVNFIGWGLVHESALASLEVSLLDHSSEINSHLHMEVKRPKNLLVLVHPRSGKGHGCKIWETVAPLFSQAKVKTKVIVTERAGHARGMLSSITNRELNLYDGVVAVGGDGFFNEILNGVLLLRHKAPYPPTPSDITPPAESECNVTNHNVNRTRSEHCDHNEDGSPLLRVIRIGGWEIGKWFGQEWVSKLVPQKMADRWLTWSAMQANRWRKRGKQANSKGRSGNRIKALSTKLDDFIWEFRASLAAHLRTFPTPSNNTAAILPTLLYLYLRCSSVNSSLFIYAGKDSESLFPKEMFRFGLIPAGSTDAIVICSTGARDAVTSALHIILGKKVHLDIAQVVRWKETNSANEEPCVRYAASFAGYGFYGDVITESEKYRWMGPKRYDYAGTKVFLQHKSYEAEVSYLEVKPKEASSSPEADPEVHSRSKKPDRMTCRVNCAICNSKYNQTNTGSLSLAQDFKGMKWSSSKGRYLSVGAAVISCRNEKAPDGLVADAHLSDGFLHLILIKECPHPYYLW